MEYSGDEIPYTSHDRRSVVILNDQIYRHKVLRINYTTYDMRRDQDSINPRTHSDIMVLSSETEEDTSSSHPYWYARVIGVFHANVLYRGPLSQTSEPQHMEFLFVRWFGRDMSWKSGWKAQQLHRVGFIPGDDDSAFGFINPDQVIRGVHLIPAFTFGRTEDLLPPSAIARSPNEKHSDWQMYYVGM